MNIKISLFVITFILLISNANAEVIAYYEFNETQGGASNALNSVEGSTISPLNNNWGNLNGSGQLVINQNNPRTNLDLNNDTLSGTVFYRIDFNSWNSLNETTDIKLQFGLRLKSGDTDLTPTNQLLNLIIRLKPASSSTNSLLSTMGAGQFTYITTLQNPSNQEVSILVEVNTDTDQFSVWVDYDSQGSYTKLKNALALNLNGEIDFIEVDGLTLDSGGGYFEIERLALANSFNSITNLQSNPDSTFNPYQENTFEYELFQRGSSYTIDQYNDFFANYALIDSDLNQPYSIERVDNVYFYTFPRRKNSELIYTLLESDVITEESWSSIPLSNLEEDISLDETFWQSKYRINTSSNKNFFKVQARIPDDDFGDLPAARYVPTDYSFVWGDHFQGSELNTENWFIGMRNPDSGDLIPGANGDYLLKDAYSGYVTEEDSFVQNGSLILRNQKRSYTGISPQGSFEYTSGWVTSMQKVNFNKGYIEVRAKFPSGVQVWPAIWLVSEDLIWGPEWDLWEYFGYRDSINGYDAMGMHLMTGYEQAGNIWPNQDPQYWDMAWIDSYDLNYNAENWHTYGWEWTETYARWWINGKVVNTLYKNQSRKPDLWPNEDMYIILNNGVRSAAPASDTSTIWPNQLEIDYIELYQKN